MTTLARLEPGTAPGFPKVPAELLTGEAPCAVVDAFLDAVVLWRDRVVDWLEAPERDVYVTDRLAQILGWTLGVRPSPGEDLAPYRVFAFPDRPPEQDARPGDCGSRRERVLEILVWRSRVYDFLADAWDTMGPGALDPRDCGNAELLFLPPASEALCLDCLQVVGGDRASVLEHAAKCIVVGRRLDEDRRAGAPWTTNPFER